MPPTPEAKATAVHFVGFRGDEYHSAVKVFGKPGFIHMGNDTRMRREIADDDVIVFANGSEAKVSERNYSDLRPQDPENGV